MGGSGTGPYGGFRPLRVLTGWHVLDWYRQQLQQRTEGAGSVLLERVGDNQRETVVISTIGLVLFVLLAPTLLPVWGVKSVVGAVTSHLGALKLNTDVLAGLALAGDVIRNAQDELAEEQEQLMTEREGFVTFAEKVQSIATANQPTGGTTTMQVSNANGGHQQLEQVREVYEETVMTTPGFDQEYGESFAEHMAAEFGPDVATIVVNGHRFDEPVKQLLIEQARESAQQREELLDIIKSENRSLETAASELDGVHGLLAQVEKAELQEYDVPQLVETDSTLRTSRCRCESVAQTRQEQIHAETNRVNGKGTFLQEYLYRDLPFSFPVLRTAVGYIERIDQRRTALVRSLVRRP